ncbi:Leucine-rich repeat-containing protein 51 [Phlyctochytrium planicorne]|nr:Leucine-rich repeat-containing protein 51 [Phlyctochytrium planicorne]
MYGILTLFGEDAVNEEPRRRHQKVAKNLHQTSVTTAIRLPNNRIVSLDQLTSVAVKLGSTLQNIGWIDLSFNCLKNIDKELLNFPNLSTLYLHANEISNLSEVDKLSNLRMLRTLTLHGNPLENVQEYRHHIISRVPGIKHLDFCVITKQDRMTSRTLIERMGKRGRGHGGGGLAGGAGDENQNAAVADAAT